MQTILSCVESTFLSASVVNFNLCKPVSFLLCSKRCHTQTGKMYKDFLLLQYTMLEQCEKMNEACIKKLTWVGRQPILYCLVSMRTSIQMHKLDLVRACVNFDVCNHHCSVKVTLRSVVMLCYSHPLPCRPICELQVNSFPPLLTAS